MLRKGDESRMKKVRTEANLPSITSLTGDVRTREKANTYQPRKKKQHFTKLSSASLQKVRSVPIMETLNTKDIVAAALIESKSPTSPIKKISFCPDPLRNFPKDFKPRFKGTENEPSEAFNHNNNNNNDSERKCNVIDLDSALLNDEDFLRLDQSKVGLECFDDLTFEKHTPQEWLDTSKGKGKLRYFIGDSHWTWKDCDIDSYDEEAQRYSVRYINEHSGEEKTKSVKRLSIVFDGEDIADAEKRIAAAVKLRELSKSIIRLEHLISRQPSDKVSVISTTQWNRIYNMSLQGISLYDNADEESYTLLKQLIEEVDAAYVNVMQRIVLFAKCSMEEEVAEKFKSLKLPSEPERLPAPEFGKIQVFPEYSVANYYERTHSFVAEHHISSKQGLFLTVSWLKGIWCDEFSQVTLIDTSIGRYKAEQKTMLQKPLTLLEFCDEQKKHCEKVTHKLKLVWRQGVIDHLLDNLQAEYNFYEGNVEAYEQSATKTMLQRFTIDMADQLADLLTRTSHAFLDYLRSYSRVGSEFNYPLFEVILRCDGGRITVEPPLEQTAKRVLHIYDRVIMSIRKMNTIDANLLTLLYLKPEMILPVGEKGDGFSDRVNEVNQLIRAVKKEIKTILHDEYAKVKQLQAVYRDDVRALSSDVTDYVAQFTEPKRVLVVKPAKEEAKATGDGEEDEEEEDEEEDEEDEYEMQQPSLEDFHAELNKYVSQDQAIRDASLDDERVGTIIVRCSELKSYLCAKSSEYVNHFLQHIVQSQMAEVKLITAEYKDICATMNKRPTNEQDLVALEQFIKSNVDSMQRLKQRVNHVHEWMALLEKFNHRVDKKSHHAVWTLKRWPNWIKEAEFDSKTSIEINKMKMIGALSIEKAKFEEQLEAYKARVEAFKLNHDVLQLSEIIKEANVIDDGLAQSTEAMINFNKRDTAFGFDITPFGILDAAKEEFEPYLSVWSMLYNCTMNCQEWTTGPFVDLDGDEVELLVNDWWTSSYRLMKLWQDTNPKVAAVAAKLRSDAESFKQYLHVIRALASPALRDRHWDDLSELIQDDVTPDGNLTLKKLLDLNILDVWEQVEIITVKAEKEFALEKNIETMKAEWAEVAFGCIEYKESGTYVIRGTDDILALLDDHIVKIQTMLGSPYIRPIIKRAKDWEGRLQYTQNLIEEWLKCQRAWMYLEPIFGSDDIMRQMPTEGRRFATVDAAWRKILQQTFEAPNVLEVTSNEKLLQNFNQANERLDLIQKGLNDYLEVKRMSFARFFFLSNEELLEILSQTKDPKAVQPFLSKCFEGIGKVMFANDVKEANHPADDVRILLLISNEGEVVELSTPVDPNSSCNKGNVELWLGDIEQSMRITVKEAIDRGAKSYPVMEDLKCNPDRSKWVLSHPGQVVLNSGQLFWTQEVTSAIIQGKLEQYTQSLNDQLTQIVHLVRGKLSKMERTTLGALSVIDVHQRDVVDEMRRQKVSDSDAFEWMAQLRYYWEHQEDDFNRYGTNPMNMMVRILNATQMYAYEYLGNSSRLIITPLTDRCYRTLMGAVSLMYGGAPAGPAGTGKTETTKDLSKAIAKQCVVFNCSDGLDYLAMAKFFKGLAQTGAWACFDEFNRIELEVLSVIAQQILTIQNAKRTRMKKFEFEGSILTLNPDANCFITMNPGYAGRQELPDNLQALFRPCAMMIPDYALIAEIKLFSFGFIQARTMARKLTQVLILCSEQLSSQKHYDYGMRAVFSILIQAGKLRQSKGDTWSEDMVIMSAISDVNLPKFTTIDIPLFKGILSDLFPGVELPNPDYASLLPAIHEVCKKDNLIPKESFVRAVIQLYETVMVRHGLMVVGETMSGKSSVINTLAKAMTKIKDDEAFKANVEISAMNPKSISQGQLYGNFDENTHEWTDGILAVTYRNCSKDTSEDRKWILFDGPVDAVWIEDMNTVLDDNKKLCLQSGEIVKMSEHMTMMFETEDLEVASPATVSRVGMVFLEQKRLDWRPLVESWLNKIPAELVELKAAAEITNCFECYFEPFVYMLRQCCVIPTPVTDSELCMSVLRLLTSTLLDIYMPNSTLSKPSDALKACEGCFIMSLVWAIGGVSDAAGRRSLDTLLKRLLTNTLDKNKVWMSFLAKNPDYADKERRELASPMPFESGSAFDYCFNPEKCLWVSWKDLTPKFMPESNTLFQNILVPTVDTVCNNYIIKALIEHNMQVLVTGDTGTGKTASIAQYLNNGIDKKKYKSLCLNFSAQTSANQTQDIIDGKLDKRRRGIFGPPIGKKLVIYVDDLNMPAKETYGAQPPIEILRQFMDYQGWFDRKECAFRKLVDIKLVAAMGPPGGGRSQITQRLVRHFSLLNFVPFNGESQTVIFTSIMEWFTKSFSPAIKSLVPSLVQASIGMYSKIEEEFLPTPAKSHYTFNLRDLSKVFQGICMCNKDTVKDKNDMIKLWGHECIRVFHDRLVDDSDRHMFFDILNLNCKEAFKVDFQSLVPKDKPLLYGNFINPRVDLDKREYVELKDHDELKTVMGLYLEDFNNISKTKMNLVLFMNAIEHISRIARVLTQPLGNALLVGVGGSGRKSLTTLAVQVSQQTLFQIEISKVYGMFEWHEDLKKMLIMAGMNGKQVVFLFSDTQVVNEGFVEDINNILNTGEVPNLFMMDEQTMIIEHLRPIAEREKLNLHTQNELLQFFVKRCRQNLHVVLAFSPVGDAFRNRLRQFPSLVNCCSIDWFTEWPENALRSVAYHFLKDVELKDDIKEGVVDICVDMQQRTAVTTKRFLAEVGRYYYVTPTSYLELINTFKSLCNSKRQAVHEKKSRYENGLSKLEETAVQVSEMQEELEALQPKLKIAQKETEEKLIVVKESQAAADITKAKVEEDERVAQEQAASCEKDKAECEEMLSEALPALEAAVKALKTLSKGDITEVKSMKKPPPAVKLTLEAVCIMMKVKPKKVPNPDGRGKIDDYWEPAQKQLLGDTKFLDRLMAYDKDNIDVMVINKVTPITQKPEFTPDVVKKASVAAAGLCKWVHAMVVYDRIAKVVAPKKAALQQANDDLALAMNDLAAKQAELKEVLDNLERLNNELQDTINKKQQLEQNVVDCSTKLERASRLISGLGGEKTRWTKFVSELSITYDNVVGDILLASGVIAYLGVFTSVYRDDCVAQWTQLLGEKQIDSTTPFLLSATLGEPVKIRSWTINKLPNDNFSIDNAIMLYSSNRWPLMIDPQGQANKWIRNVEAEAGLKVVKQTNSDFVRSIENAVTFGVPVLLENLPESIDPILEPILSKQIISRGGALTMQIGDNTVEYDMKFRFYMTTKLRNPHYPPETCVKVNLLNFMATQEGLQDQMLGITVKRETPELEQKREKLIIEDAQNKSVLKDIEDKILELLANSEGNILDDEILINTLSESKVTSNHIMEQVAVAEKTQIKIEQTRKGYQPVALRSSNLFFCVADLASVDPMYQFSLEWYNKLFNLAIDRADKSSDLEQRLENLNSKFAEILYANVCRSLFEKDKLLFSFLLCIKVLQISNSIDNQELRFLLKGSSSVDLAQPNPVDEGKGWLNDKSWGDFLSLCNELPVFVEKDFLAQVVGDLEYWKNVYSAKEPLVEIQAKFAEEFSRFQLLLLLRCIRPDKLVPAIQDYIMHSIGKNFIEPPAFDLLAGYHDSSCTTPVLFVLTPGADPMTELIRVAEKLGFANKLVSVSLGQGQGPIAEKALREGVDTGTWVCLQNCHVATSWLPTLEKLCEEFTPERTHEDFRLWLTAMPCKEFPVSVLQNGIKMTLEPPRGFRANMTGSYIAMEEEWFESCPKPQQFKKLVYGICFFHALVRERCRFGPLGWNIQYTFSVPDLRITLDQLMLFLTDYKEIPFKMLRYLAGECNYGGRVTDDKDRRLILNILSDFYTPEILEDGYKFSPSGTYYAPPEGDLQSYLDHIKAMPYNEHPEIFGLHENADIMSAIQATNSLVGTALALQPRSADGAGMSWADTLMELAVDIENKLPELFDVEAASVRYPVKFEESMNTVLVQELGRFNKLLHVIKKSLHDVQLAIKGLVVMSRELEEMGNSMTKMQVPEMWNAVAYPSLKPLGSWVNDLLARLAFLQNWLDHDKPNVFWISGFFFIPGFLTGTRQNFARKYTIPMDLIKYDYEVLTWDQCEQLDGPAKDGAYISGLFLEGANWDDDANALSESKPKELYVPMPYIRLISTKTPNHEAHRYVCPVYKTSERFGMLSTTGHSTNFVLMVSINMLPEHDEKHWIKRGVALLTQLNQ